MSDSSIPESFGERPKGKNPFLLFLQGGFCPPKVDRKKNDDDDDDDGDRMFSSMDTPKKSSNIPKKGSTKKKHQSRSVEPLIIHESKEDLNGEEISDIDPKNDDELEFSSISIYAAIFAYIAFIIILYANRNLDIMEEFRQGMENFLSAEFVTFIMFLSFSSLLFHYSLNDAESISANENSVPPKEKNESKPRFTVSETSIKFVVEKAWGCVILSFLFVMITERLGFGIKVW